LAQLDKKRHKKTANFKMSVNNQLNEIKQLMLVENSFEEIENSFETHLDSKIRNYEHFYNWMCSQHNSSIRAISGYLYDLDLELAENSSQDCKSYRENSEKIIEGLISDHEKLEVHKETINGINSKYRDTLPSKKEDEFKLNKAALKLNTEFMYKEIKKIIRFKYGLTKIIDEEIASLEKSKTLLEAKKQLINLIPEAYDIESLRNAKVSISNKARSICMNTRSSQHVNRVVNNKNIGDESNSSLTSEEPSFSANIADENHQAPENFGNPNSSPDMFLDPSPQLSALKSQCDCCGFLCNTILARNIATDGSDTTTVCEFDESDGQKYYLSTLSKKCTTMSQNFTGLSLNPGNSQLKCDKK